MSKIDINKSELTGYAIATTISVALITGALFHKLSLDITEVLGFVTGALTVWLVVKQNIWNWPIGIANNIFFILLFWRSHLYADMGLQFVYIVISVYGWYWWLNGGRNRSKLTVSRIRYKEALLLLGVTIIGTYAMMIHLTKIDDAAPFLDALTTVMSLIAQYMLTKKYLENWLVWISVDVIYIYLYASKSLVLTGILYFIFLCMCIVGFRQWRTSYAEKHKAVRA